MTIIQELDVIGLENSEKEQFHDDLIDAIVAFAESKGLFITVISKVKGNNEQDQERS